MSEAFRTVALTAVALGAAVGWFSLRATRLPVSSPLRLVAELRLAQTAALLLAFTAGAYIGFAAAYERTTGTGLDVALALGFFVLATLVITREPLEALTALALAFCGHAVVDILHRPALLPPGIAPPWYSTGCAVFNVYLAALCYLPVLRR